MEPLRSLVQSILSRFGATLIRQDKLRRLERIPRGEWALRQLVEFVGAMPANRLGELQPVLRQSKSQFLQDLFVLCETGFKRDGFFVEFGATNGVDLSNTYLLETAFGWRGILAEPARRWHSALSRNRRASLEFNCVWTTSNETVVFNETDIGEFSTIDDFTRADLHQHLRESGDRYEVGTVSLADMLVRHNAPKHIDYLSLDTEGSEYAILESFAFRDYRIDIVTVEHNFMPARQKIHAFMVGHGYVRVHEPLSGMDDWYVHRDK